MYAREWNGIGNWNYGISNGVQESELLVRFHVNMSRVGCLWRLGVLKGDRLCRWREFNRYYTLLIIWFVM